MRYGPKVLLQWIFKSQTEEVYAAEADCVYCVLYDGVPVGVRTLVHGRDQYKYPRSVWTAKGWAIRAAEKLNRRHNSVKFVAARIRAATA